MLLRTEKSIGEGYAKKNKIFDKHAKSLWCPQWQFLSGASWTWADPGLWKRHPSIPACTDLSWWIGQHNLWGSVEKSASLVPREQMFHTQKMTWAGWKIAESEVLMLGGCHLCMAPFGTVYTIHTILLGSQWFICSKISNKHPPGVWVGSNYLGRKTTHWTGSALSCIVGSNHPPVIRPKQMWLLFHCISLLNSL